MPLGLQAPAVMTPLAGWACLMYRRKERLDKASTTKTEDDVRETHRWLLVYSVVFVACAVWLIVALASA